MVYSKGLAATANTQATAAVALKYFYKVRTWYVKKAGKLNFIANYKVLLHKVYSYALLSIYTNAIML